MPGYPGRVRQREVHVHEGGHGPAGQGLFRVRHGNVSGRGPAGEERGGAAPSAGRPGGYRAAKSHDLLRSPLPCRRPDRRELRRPQQLEWGGDPPTLPGAAGKNAHPQPGGGAGEVPPPALRRDAPADHDRNCHRHGARTAHCGRAHHRH